jgi:serine/threonine protein kinase
MKDDLRGGLKRFGKYEVVEQIGNGPIATVYRAIDLESRHPVAVKALDESLARESSVMRQFRVSAATASRLSHPNIAAFYDFGVAGGTPFIAMELLDGNNLESLIASRNPTSIIRRLDISLQACRGLQKAHEMGVVHGRIKRTNIAVDSNGVVKLMDFGMPDFPYDELNFSTWQSYFARRDWYGTLGPLTTQWDLFALASISYHLLTGAHPFIRPELESRRRSIVDNHPTSNLSITPTSVSVMNPECPQELDNILGNVLNPKSQRRYQSVEEMSFEIEQLIARLKERSEGKGTERQDHSNSGPG